MANGDDEDSEILNKRLASLIRYYREEIVKDCDVRYVVPILLTEFVLEYEDKQIIDKEKTFRNQSTALLDILLEKSQSNVRALVVFKDALKENYPWLHDKLSEDVPDNPNGPTNPELLNNNQQISKNSHVPQPHYSLEMGGVQCLPVLAIERKTLLDDIQKQVSDLKRGHFLVLTGMAGCGKTVLATQAVHRTFADKKNFEGGIYWLSFGKECSESKDALLAKMRILCSTLLNSTTSPHSLEHGTELLKGAFLSRPRAILILDNVWSLFVIRHFDVGARTVMTLRDSTLLDVVVGRCNRIHIPPGFSEQESLLLFQKALNVADVKHVPDEAKRIHRECSGSPMVISLIASLLQDLQDNGCSVDQSRWNHYYEALSKRKYSQMRKDRGYEHASIYDAISLTYDSLNPKDKVLYENFAIFESELGIPCEVLMLFWDKSKFEVEDIMLNFEKKSISSKEYDSQKKSYLYSIPVLLLSFLKYTLKVRDDDNAEKDLHIRFVNKYREKCGGQFHELKDDGYFHFYIGYHLYKSGQHDLFKLFLDLRFIGEKIRIAGPADVLIDLRKYKDYITAGDEDKNELWEQIREFTYQEGHLIYGQDDVDVLQLALIVPGLKLIKHQAQSLIQSDTNHLYIEWTNSKSNQRIKPENNYVMNDIVHCLKFVAADFFLVGLNSGLIQLWKSEDGSCHYEFSGHKDAIKCLDVFSSDSLPHSHQQNGHNRSSHKHIFVSSSEDKSCKLWDLKTIMEDIKLKESSSDSSETPLSNSPSPKLHQKLYTFSLSSLRDKSILSFDFHTAPVSCIEISMDGSQIVSTSCNELLVWSTTNGQVISKISSSSPEAPFGICRFLSNSTDFLLVSSENQVCLLVPKRPSIQSRIEGHHMKIVAMLCRNENSFITVSENEVGIWNISQVNRNEREKRVLRGPLQSLPINVSNTHVNGYTNGSLSNGSINKGESHKTLQSTLSSGGGNYGDFLEPISLHIREKSNSNSSRSSKEWSVSYKNFSGISSSSSKSDCYSIESNKPVTTFVDIGSHCIQILRENVSQRKKEGSGLFLCAALCNGMLACGTTDHKIVICELTDLTFVYEFNGHNGWVTAITFSPLESLTLLTGSDDQLVKIWDGDDWEKMEAEPMKTTIFDSVIVDDGLNETKNFFLSLFATDRQTIQVYKDSKIFGESKCLNSGISVVSLCNDGSHAAIGTKNGRIFGIKNLLHQSNSSLLSNPGKNAFVPILDVEQLGSPNVCILSLEFSSSNEYLAAGTIEQILIFKSFFPHWIVSLESPLVNLHFSHEKTLTICLKNGSIKVENVENKVHLKGWNPEVAELKVSCSSLSLDSKTLVLGTADDGILIFDISELHGVIDSNFKTLSCKHNSQIRSLAISSDKQKLAVGHENGLITIWDLSVNPFLESRNLVLHKSCVRSIDFAQIKFYGDSLWLVSCGEQLALWTLEKPEEKIKKTTFMEERRRRKSGENSRPSSRLSLQVPAGQKIGRKGKRELLQSFPLRGKWAQKVVSNIDFTHFVTVDDTGVFYLLKSIENF